MGQWKGQLGMAYYWLDIRLFLPGIECNVLVWCSGYHVCLTHACKIAKGLWFDPRH